MHDLLKYSSTIYDANCIVYYAFHFTEQDSEGKTVTVVGPHTRWVHRITQELIAAKMTIGTIRIAWQEAEKVVIASALKQAIKEGLINEALKTKGQISDMLSFRLASALRMQLVEMKKEKWFFIDMRFVPAAAKLNALKEAYKEFCLDPIKQKKIPPYKGEPSIVDLALIIFAEENHLPLLTNDRELYNFNAELQAKHFCHLIKGLPHVRFS